MTQEQHPGTRNEISMRRRVEVLRLPVVPMTAHGWFSAPQGIRWGRQPAAVGIGPDDLGVAVWPDPADPTTAFVTSRTITGVEAGRLEVHDVPARVDFVQPLHGGGSLLASARSRSEPNAAVWDADGAMLARANVGDALEHLLTSATGQVWVGYFDEAVGTSGPSGHGLARFNPDLSLDWTYPGDAATSAPSIFDCYGLNVTGEAAYTYAYTKFHIVSSRGRGSHDFGAAPYRGAKALLVDAPRAALIGGYGPDYDLITPLAIGTDSVQLAGEARRLVLPDGLELPQHRLFARGGVMHLTAGSRWYSVNIDELWSA